MLFLTYLFVADGGGAIVFSQFGTVPMLGWVALNTAIYVLHR
jgi:hypothetical protein